MNTTSRFGAIVLWAIIGIWGFMIYSGQNTLPLADVLSATTNQDQGQIMYTIQKSTLEIFNATQTLSWTLAIPVRYDTNSVWLMTDSITSDYSYTFDHRMSWAITIFIEGVIEQWSVVQIPLTWDTSNISITSPNIVTNNTQQSLSITRM